MGNGPFNIALGRAVELHNRVKTNDPANSALVVVLLQAAEADAALRDHDDLAALLGAVGNTEATFTNYARKVLTDADLTAFAVDDVNERTDIDIPDQTWAAAGGATNNSIVKMLVCYDPDTTGGTDAAIVPLAHLDYAITTDGSDITATIDAAGFYRAA